MARGEAEEDLFEARIRCGRVLEVELLVKFLHDLEELTPEQGRIRHVVRQRILPRQRVKLLVTVTNKELPARQWFGRLGCVWFKTDIPKRYITG